MKKLFCATVIRLVTVDGQVQYWLMNREDQGLASRGVCYFSLQALVDDWDINLGDRVEQDAVSLLIRAYPREEGVVYVHDHHHTSNRCLRH
jgi:hypothetical protein